MKKKRAGVSLFQQYFLQASSIIILSIIFLGGSLMIFVHRYWTQENVQLLERNVYEVTGIAKYRLSSSKTDRDSYGMISNTLNNISHAIGAELFICDEDGNIVFCGCGANPKSEYSDKNYSYHHLYSIPQSVLSDAAAENYSATTNFDGTISTSYVVANPIKIDYNGEDYTYIVFAVQDVKTATRANVLEFLKMFGLSMIIALSASFILAWIMTYRITKPLREMSAATKAYANGDFTPRVSETGIVEMSELAAGFNSMAKSLSILETSRRSFVANVSHELKTPMTTIGGFIDGILDGTIDDSRRNYYLGIVSDEIKRLSRLVTGMLNMSKIEAGELHLKSKSFDLTSMTIKTVLSFEHLLDSKHIDVLGLDDLEPCNVKADPDMINQVVYNLIDNAVKFTPENGYIKIKLARTSDSVVMAVRNSGKGIPQDERERIFERFYKIDKSRSYDVKGAGLGLYIVKTIIDMHSGQINVSSVENEYTEFCFSLPNVE